MISGRPPLQLCRGALLGAPHGPMVPLVWLSAICPVVRPRGLALGGSTQTRGGVNRGPCLSCLVVFIKLHASLSCWGPDLPAADMYATSFSECFLFNEQASAIPTPAATHTHFYSVYVRILHYYVCMYIVQCVCMQSRSFSASRLMRDTNTPASFGPEGVEEVINQKEKEEKKRKRKKKGKRKARACIIIIITCTMVTAVGTFLL